MAYTLIYSIYLELRSSYYKFSETLIVNFKIKKFTPLKMVLLRITSSSVCNICYNVIKTNEKALQQTQLPQKTKKL